jgi:hypothetical protein
MTIHFEDRSIGGWWRELQIPPLRFASVGMTKGGVLFTSAAVTEGWRESHLPCHVIIQIGPQPAFDLFHAHPFAFGVVFHLESRGQTGSGPNKIGSVYEYSSKRETLK